MILTLSSYDPSDSAEGNLDPLGLNPIAERLATKLAPGVRERMSNPGFLVPITIGAFLTNEIDHSGNEGEVEPFLAYEWIIVQHYFLLGKKKQEEISYPGKNKVRAAFLKKLPLNNQRYLQSAYTTGFHGVYRTLAAELNLTQENKLSSNGEKLLSLWEKIYHLTGFINGSSGEGAELRNILTKSIQQNMLEERSRPWNWPHYDKMKNYFLSDGIHHQQRKFIFELLAQEGAGHRSEILYQLKAFRESKKILYDDQSFHQFLLKHASRDLKTLIKAIIAYEQFCFLLDAGFRQIRFCLSKEKKQLSSKDVAEKIQFGHEKVVHAFFTAYEKLQELGESGRFQQQFADFGSLSDKISWVENLLHYHQSIQIRKPPKGKLPWIEKLDNGRWLVRSLYREAEAPLKKFQYVNYYRTQPLFKFLYNLKK